MIRLMKPMMLLWAEDDENDRLFIERAVTRAKLAVDLHFADDGVKAWAYLAGFSPFDDRERFPMPRALVTDLKMPQCGGFELIRRVRADERFLKLPVFVFSASDLQRDFQEAGESGATGYVCKPAGLAAWQERIRDIVVQVDTLDVPANA